MGRTSQNEINNLMMANATLRARLDEAERQAPSREEQTPELETVQIVSEPSEPTERSESRKTKDHLVVVQRVSNQQEQDSAAGTLKYRSFRDAVAGGRQVVTHTQSDTE